MTSVDRAFRLLRALPRTGGTLSELSRETDLPVATVSRIMGALEQAGAVSRSNKNYRVGPLILELGGGADEPPFDLLPLAMPHLHELRDLTGETAGIAESQGTDHVHLGQVATTHDVTVTDWTGVRVAGHSGCIGFCLMAHWEPSRLRRYLAAELERFSPSTLTDPSDIEEQLERVRTDGRLWTVDQYAVGVTTVAAPVFDRDGQAVASLYVHGPSYRFPTEDGRTEVGALVQGRAEVISEVLGHRKEVRS